MYGVCGRCCLAGLCVIFRISLVGVDASGSKIGKRHAANTNDTNSIESCFSREASHTQPRAPTENYGVAFLNSVLSFVVRYPSTCHLHLFVLEVVHLFFLFTFMPACNVGRTARLLDIECGNVDQGWNLQRVPVIYP